MTPPVAERLVVYEEPKVAPGNAPAGVVMVRMPGTVSVTVCVTVGLPTAAAVSITVNVVATVVGAV